MYRHEIKADLKLGYRNAVSAIGSMTGKDFFSLHNRRINVFLWPRKLVTFLKANIIMTFLIKV